MRVYDIKILKSTTGKEYIKFFFKTFRKKEIKTEIEKFNNNIKLTLSKKISDEKMKNYDDEKGFIKKFKLQKVIENTLGSTKIILYKNSDILFYKIESTTNDAIDFEDEDILLRKEFFINGKYINYIIIKNSTGG